MKLLAFLSFVLILFVTSNSNVVQATQEIVSFADPEINSLSESKGYISVDNNPPKSNVQKVDKESVDALSDNEDKFDTATKTFYKKKCKVEVCDKVYVCKKKECCKTKKYICGYKKVFKKGKYGYGHGKYSYKPKFCKKKKCKDCTKCGYVKTCKFVHVKCDKYSKY